MYWLLAHMIGDYLLQNDWMANNKKISNTACLVHAAAYMIPFLPLLLWGCPIWKLLLIGGQHYFQDRGNAVVWFLHSTGKSNFTKAPMAPWSIILCDNIFHIIFMAAVFAI